MLRIQDLKKSYAQPDGGRVTILNIPKLSLNPAEQMVLIGDSGGGKSTLLHLIAGIRRPDSGSIRIDGTDICKLPESTRDRFRASRIGYIFQTFNLLDGFSAYENVLLGMTFGVDRTDPERAKSLLERVGLGHRLTHRPSKLSVGEQQRVAVARALANRPKLLLADEPTANVDPKNQEQIVSLIRDTCVEEGIALLIVTHSMEVAGQFDRVDRIDNINQAIAESK
ncbi:MAG: ABC transporter ATP-binding protein [bacterium]|nr:ABC transporter ATP-binding protein [bacterium]